MSGCTLNPRVADDDCADAFSGADAASSMVLRGRAACCAALTLAASTVTAANAEEAPPIASFAVRDATEVWIGKGLVPLNKFQVSGTIDGAGLGDPGWRLHAQVFRTDGSSLSRRVGDIQTISNIEALNATRLFELWVERAFGPPNKPTASLRAGLIDLNADFDSIEPASVMISSSHGIGADLASYARSTMATFATQQGAGLARSSRKEPRPRVLRHLYPN